MLRVDVIATGSVRAAGARDSDGVKLIASGRVLEVKLRFFPTAAAC